ncbi:UNVERIFIED_CONTAM: hypothetical protein Sradi_1532900 [Sesamum radiatum]|uniref:DUF4283 domain-containing protein n=1 Tax=Sesamum radiatum TaxID=300843 RepID=A0AAW2UA77_SESRA
MDKLHHQATISKDDQSCMEQPRGSSPVLQNVSKVPEPAKEHLVSRHRTDSPLAPSSSQPNRANPIFVGTFPLARPLDIIAEGFHTLSFIPPEFQNGEVLVRPTQAMIDEGAKHWLTTAVGYFLGRKPYFHHLKAFVQSSWPTLVSVSATSNGFYFFKFKTEIAMEEIIEDGSWLFQGQPIVLQWWEPGMNLRKHTHTEVPVWIRLKHLPMEYWSTEGLSMVASRVGKPLYQDIIFKSKISLIIRTKRKQVLN